MTENFKTDRHVLAFKDSLGNPVREIGRFDAGQSIVLVLVSSMANALEKAICDDAELTPVECEQIDMILEQIAHERDALAGE